MSSFLRYDELMGSVHGDDGGRTFALVCVLCGRPETEDRLNRCTDCGGAIDALHDLTDVQIRPSPNPLLRYFDLLPLRGPASAAWLGEGNTPCIHAERLGAAVGLDRLYLKDEGANPTRSTKDRIASLGLSRFGEVGVKALVIASTGNSSTAYARAAQLLGGVQLHVFCGTRFLPRLNYVDHPAVITHVVAGGFDAAGAVAKRFAADEGIHFEGGFFSLSRREGLKLAYLEAFDQMPQAPAFVFQAVSSGMGLLGGYKGALEYHRLGRLSRVPGFVAVQQESCAPMVRAFHERTEQIADEHIVRNPTGVAEAILRGNPTQSYRYIRAVCEDSGGTMTAVDESAIHAARRQLEELEGIRSCHAAAAALAGAIRLRGEGLLEADTPVLVNLTGADRPLAPVPTQLVTHEAPETQ
jgi:threonine synthase